MATEVNVVVGIGGLGITGIRNYARAEIALHGALPRNVLLVEVDLCSLTGRDEERSVFDLIPPEQYLVLHAPEFNVGARCAALSHSSPIHKWIDVDAVSDIGNTGAIGGNQRPVILELVALMEPAWWESITGRIGQAIRQLAELHGLSIETVRIKVVRSTLGTVGAAGIILASSLQAGLRQVNTCVVDTVFLLADYAERVPDRRRARASTAAALDEIDRRGRGILIGADSMFQPISGIHVLAESFSEAAALAEDAVLCSLMVAGKLDGPLVTPLTLRNNTRDRAEVTTAMSGRILVPDSAILHQRLVARMAARSAEAFADNPGSLSVDAQVEVLLSSSLGQATSLCDLIARNHSLRNASRRLMAEIVEESGRAADREIFSRADNVLDEEELKASAESKVYAWTLALKNAADRAMDGSLRDALGFFSTGVSHSQKLREELLHLKESREQEAATCRNKINAAVGQATVADTTRGTEGAKQSLWKFVANALREEKHALSSVPVTPDNLRAKYIGLRGDLQIIRALISAVDYGISVLRAYETEVRVLRGVVLDVASTFDQLDKNLGYRASERIRRFAGLSLAAESEVVESLAVSRIGDAVRVATGALARLGSSQISTIGRTAFERAMREEVEGLVGTAETYSLDRVVGELPGEVLDRLARSLVPAKPSVAFSPGVRTPEVFSVAHVGHPRMAAAVRRTHSGMSNVTVCPAPDGDEYFAVTYTGVFGVRDLECYSRAKEAFEEAREEGWATQIVDKRVLELADDGTDDKSLEMTIAKATIAEALQTSGSGRWYYVEPGSGMNPSGMDSAALHAAFGDALGSSIAEVVRTLRSKPALRRALSSAWDSFVALKSPTQMLDSIDSVMASRKLHRLSGHYKVLKAEFLKTLRESAFDSATAGLMGAVGRNGKREEAHVD